MRSPRHPPGRCWSFALFTTGKYLLWIYTFVAFGAIMKGLQADLDTFAPGASSYKMEVTAAALDYSNPEYMAEGGYMRVLRKDSNASRGVYAFWPVIKDLPADLNTTFVAYKKLSNRWVESFIKGSMTLCEQLESQMQFFRFFFENSNFPHKCPVKKHNYTAELESLEKMAIPPGFPKSEWKMKFKWHLQRTTIMVNWVELKMDQKESRRPKNHPH